MWLLFTRRSCVAAARGVYDYYCFCYCYYSGVSIGRAHARMASDEPVSPQNAEWLLWLAASSKKSTGRGPRDDSISSVIHCVEDMCGVCSLQMSRAEWVVCPPPPLVVLGCGFSVARVWLCEDH